MNLPKIIIHCQYVYGLGHLIRALHLAKGLTNEFDVYFLNGGENVKNINIDKSIKFIQMPSIYKKEDNSKLSSVSSDYSLFECLELRSKIIKETLEMVKPDVIVSEHFPFGFLFEKEVIHLIDTAKCVNSKVKVVCSVRDVIESSKGGLDDKKTVTILNELYDLLLIHGDEKLIPLESSFSLAKDIKIKLSYTGYVIDDILRYSTNRLKTIIVSVGGGRIGNELIDVVLNAFKLIKETTKHDLLIFNGAFNNDSIVDLKDNRIQVFDFDRTKFLKHLSKSDITISLGGYNSMLESLRTGNKIVIYNREFLGSNEEQDIRITTFKNLGLVDIITKDDLTAENLAIKFMTLINKDVNSERPIEINFSGVKNTVCLIKQLVNE